MQAIVIGVVISFIIIIVLLCRYAIYLPNCGGEVDAEITSSFGSILGATLTPLWSIVATYIYYATLKVQANALKTSQENNFSQSLNFLIVNFNGALRDISLTIPKCKKYKQSRFVGSLAISYLYLSMKNVYKITEKEYLNPIFDWERYLELIESFNEVENIDDIKFEDDLREYEIDVLLRNCPSKYFMQKEKEEFDKHDPLFTYLYKLSNDDLKWKYADDSKYSHIKHSFDVVWNKYGNKVEAYFKSIELSIDYIYEQKGLQTDKTIYASWVTTNLSQTTLLFFYYYLYCQKEKKENFISHCKILKVFDQIDTLKLIDGNINHLKSNKRK